VSELVFPPVSPLRAGLTCRCPRCRQGRLFNGFLTVAPRCGTCDLDFGSADSGDGPAVFVVLILGIFVVGGALAVEMAFTPPLWLHMVVWLPVATAGALALLRPFKGVLIALQFHHQAGQDRHVD
jgi:uncharacterized protein (DUF983 family)